MKFKVILSSVFLFFCNFIIAQELNCTVKVLSPAIQGTERSVFESLETAVKEFMNNTRWTNDNFKQDEKIEDLIDGKTGIPNVVIADEKIQQWLQSFPDVVKEAKLHDLLKPLQFDESDLKNLIEAFHKVLPSTDTLDKNAVDFSYIEMERKNELNKLSKDYFDNVIQRHYSYFESIRNFLKDPINKKLKEQFDDLVDELNAKITIYQNEYFAFEKLLDELYDYVLSNNQEFFGSGKKRLIRVFINYMYCNCFIGKKEDA